MDVAHALSWLIVGWSAISLVWMIADDPITTTYHSAFYRLVAASVGVVALVLSLVVLL